MKIIDAHVHIGKNSFNDVENNNFNYNLCSTYEEIIEVMNMNKIDKAIILPIPYKDFNIEKTNNYVFEAYQKYPNRLIPFCRIDKSLEENLKKGFRGVKLHLLYEDINIKDIKKELQLIEDANVPLLVHAKFANKVEQIEEIFKYAPNINIILAHMGRGKLYTGEQTRENALKLKKYSNLYMDLSTVGDLQAIINVCEIIGYDRVVYASDYPFGKIYFNEKYNYSNELKMLQKYLDKKNVEYIFYKNIEKLLTVKENIFIRRAKKEDIDCIMKIFNEISIKDRKFLAYKSKASLIKQIIKSEKHCYVAMYKDSIIGFLRESGRPEQFSLLEEIVVLPEYRNKGVAKKLLDYYHKIFHKNMAKTNASNEGMINLLYKYRYLPKNPNAPRIINWIRKGEEDGYR